MMKCIRTCLLPFSMPRFLMKADDFVNRLWGQRSLEDKQVINARIADMKKGLTLTNVSKSNLEWATVQHFDLCGQWKKHQDKLLKTLYEFGDDNGPAFFNVLSQSSYFPSNHVASLIGHMHNLSVVGWQLLSPDSLQLIPSIFGFGVSQDGDLPPSCIHIFTTDSKLEVII